MRVQFGKGLGLVGEFGFGRDSSSYIWLLRAQLIGLILTSIYLTKRLSE